jgi:hypothetical protein
MIIGLVTNLLSDMFSGFHRFQEEFSQYKHWTKSLKLEPHMRHKIESFFMNLWRRHNLLPSSSRDDQINTLNPAMQREVKVALYSDILAHLAILKGIDSLDHVIPDLANAVMSRYFLRNDAIIKIGTAADGLFIVDLGLAGVVASGDDTDGHAADEVGASVHTKHHVPTRPHYRCSVVLFGIRKTRHQSTLYTKEASFLVKFRSFGRFEPACLHCDSATSSP